MHHVAKLDMRNKMHTGFRSIHERWEGHETHNGPALPRHWLASESRDFNNTSVKEAGCFLADRVRPLRCSTGARDQASAEYLHYDKRRGADLEMTDSKVRDILKQFYLARVMQALPGSDVRACV